jgi:hypothetical protein
MKPTSAKRSDPVMRFFTPELFLRYNSDLDEVADAADAEWEAALKAYRAKQEKMRSRMPSQVKKLAGLCLHDAELVGLEEEFHAVGGKGNAPPIWSAVASLLLQSGRTLQALVYALADRIERTEPARDWPFARDRRHWLYDEIEDLEGGGFVHRILFSDGSIVVVPFLAVHTNGVKLTDAEKAPISRVSAWR